MNLDLHVAALDNVFTQAADARLSFRRVVQRMSAIKPRVDPRARRPVRQAQRPDEGEAEATGFTYHAPSGPPWGPVPVWEKPAFVRGLGVPRHRGVEGHRDCGT